MQSLVVLFVNFNKKILDLGAALQDLLLYVMPLEQLVYICCCEIQLQVIVEQVQPDLIEVGGLKLCLNCGHKLGNLLLK